MRRHSNEISPTYLIMKAATRRQKKLWSHVVIFPTQISCFCRKRGKKISREPISCHLLQNKIIPILRNVQNREKMSCSQAKPNNIFNPPPLKEVNDPCERPRVSQKDFFFPFQCFFNQKNFFFQGREHVNIFGDSNYCIGKLKSETHESLEEGIRDKYQTASKLFPIVNFSSYPLLE